MSRIVFASGLLIITLSLSGCVVAIGNSGRKHDPDCVHVHDTDSVIAEIDAAGRLFSDPDKADIYTAIAQRQGLSSKAQSHLVKEAFRHLFSEPSKEKVIALIENPCFDDVGKKAVLANLRHLFSDSSKKSILLAINRREQAPKVIETEMAVEVVVQEQPG